MKRLKNIRRGRASQVITKSKLTPSVRRRLLVGKKIHEYIERGTGKYMSNVSFAEAIHRMQKTGNAAAEVNIGGILGKTRYISRIDRLELRDGGRVLRICEIKTGRNKKYKPDQLHRRQLAVYSQLVQKQLNRGIEIETYIYYINQSIANKIIKNHHNTFIFEVVHVDCTNYELSE